MYQGGAGKELNPDPASAGQPPSALSQPRLCFSRMRLLRRLSPQQSRNVATQTFPPQESANGLCQGQVVISAMPGVYFSVPVNKSQARLTPRSSASPMLKTKMLLWIQSTSSVQVLLFRI